MAIRKRFCRCFRFEPNSDLATSSTYQPSDSVFFNYILLNPFLIIQLLPQEGCVWCRNPKKAVKRKQWCFKRSIPQLFFDAVKNPLSLRVPRHYIADRPSDMYVYVAGFISVAIDYNPSLARSKRTLPLPMNGSST